MTAHSVAHRVASAQGRPPTVLTKVRTHPAPDPLPSTWARAIANSITRRLRKPWSPSRATRALTNTSSGGHSTATKIATPHPTVELLFSRPYATGTIPASTRNAHPRILWHLRQTKMIAAIPEAQHHLLEQYLRPEPTSGPDPLPFRGTGGTLRRSEATTAGTAALMLRIVNAATIITCDEHDYQKAIAVLEFEGSDPSEWAGFYAAALDNLP